MYIRILLLVALVHSWKLTARQNEHLKKHCGARFLGSCDALSLGSRRARAGQFPWIAALIFRKNRNGPKGNTGCSGVQISKRHILTAAHCLVQIDGNVCREAFERKLSPGKMGKVPYKKLPIDKFEIYIGSRNVHPEMNKNNYYKIGKAQFGDLDPCYDPHGDLAIIELDRDIPATEGTPICMPPRNEVLQKKLTAVGYGITPNSPNPDGTVLNYLQSVNVDFENVLEANKVFTTLTNGRSICRGDSGGPSVQLNKENKYTLVGITISLYPGCDSYVPESEGRRNNFTDVRKYLDWICESTGVCPIDDSTGEKGDRQTITRNKKRISKGIADLIHNLIGALKKAYGLRIRAHQRK